MSTILNFTPTDKTLLARWGDDPQLKAYLKALDKLLKSKKYETRRAYVPAIKQFFVMHRWICPKDITIQHARQYKETLLAKGKKETTVLWRIAAMSSYAKLLTKTKGPDGQYLMKDNPFRQISREDINPEAFKSTQQVSVKELLKTLEVPRDVRGLRDRAILAFILFTKANRNEISNLRVKDLNQTHVTLRCSQRERTIELPEPVHHAIHKYWLAAGRQPKPSEGVFAAISSKRQMQKRCQKTPQDPLGQEMIRKILKRASKRNKGSIDGRIVRAVKKVSIPIQKLSTIVRDKESHLEPTQYKISKSAPEDQLIKAYVKMLETDELTQSFRTG